MLTFAAAVFFLMMTPGPGVLSTAGVGAAFGARVATRYVLGLFIGTNLVCIAIVSGVTAAILADDRLRTLLFFASIAYLTYLALRIAFAGSKVAFIERARPPGITGGILLQAINPKAYAVNTALFTGFGFWPQSFAVEMALKFLIVNAIWIPIHFSWLWLGIAVQRMNLARRTQRVINIAMAASMMIVVLLAALSQV
ncbi:amino acid transporter LysE [Roseobacter cerasinus]|uniref:Amino acid transporter LysE n=1 Tax=Roseobacter cerasinus TaxID=2602289 RepID=A0A640VQJ4_9RHOB|nr:LysE family transporter [Roseobacter cerasinus]GFE49145.1 amino acid transporter LysE [Roseobacter cerasinus]